MCEAFVSEAFQVSNNTVHADNQRFEPPWGLSLLYFVVNIFSYHSFMDVYIQVYAKGYRENASIRTWNECWSILVPIFTIRIWNESVIVVGSRFLTVQSI